MLVRVFRGFVRRVSVSSTDYMTNSSVRWRLTPLVGHGNPHISSAFGAVGGPRALSFVLPKDKKKRKIDPPPPPNKSKPGKPDSQPNTKKKTLPGAAGRIVFHQSSGIKTKNANQPKLCVGCGTEVVAGGSNTRTISGGAEAVDESVSKRRAKKSRYVDPTDSPYNSGFLCARCKALQSNNIWKAYDALRDVSPTVFFDQLKHIVRRRQFGICLMIVDATDPEHTAVKRLRDAIGKTPLILVFNKIDLLPRFTKGDERFLRSRIQNHGIRVIGSYSVSAETNAGIATLAKGMVGQLGGRDLFVVGAANVGKSSLVKKLSTVLASSVYFKGYAKQATKRRDAAINMNITGSNLPGTTLQAVRVPCFASKGHALWDTPGIINSRALQYRIFPSHLMEPLTRPGAIRIPDAENGLAVAVRSGYSILVEAAWMVSAEDDEKPCVLARVDMDESTGTVFAQGFIHPSLTMRVVRTKNAPVQATVPPSHLDAVNKRIRQATGNKHTGLAESYSLPLSAYITKDRPRGEFRTDYSERDNFTEKYRMDIVFASVGWIGFTDNDPYTLIPHCVEGSVFSKRRSLYPMNVGGYAERHGTPELEPDDLDNEEVRREIKVAFEQGRHLANDKSKSNDHHDSHDDFYDYDDYSEFGNDIKW